MPLTATLTSSLNWFCTHSFVTVTSTSHNSLFDALVIVDVSCKAALTDIYGVVAASKIENIMMGQ